MSEEDSTKSIYSRKAWLNEHRVYADKSEKTVKMDYMPKEDIVKMVVKETRYPAAAISEIYESIFKHLLLSITLCTHDIYKLPHIGTLRLKHINPRKYYNRRIKEEAISVPRKRLVFKASVLVKQTVKKNSINLLKAGEID